MTVETSRNAVVMPTRAARAFPEVRVMKRLLIFMEVLSHADRKGSFAFPGKISECSK
jgi:hypothetical protein